METADTAQYWLTRFCFQRSLGFIYLLGFLTAVNQFGPLVGERGLLPVRLFLERVTFWDAPSLFWINCSDRFLLVMAWAGVVLSLMTLTGLSDAYGITVSTGVWGLLWILYLSFVHTGQIFYSFGWESLLLETGFLAIFLGPTDISPPVIIIWLLCWVLFRVMFGAGMIKLRGDPCWRDLTCLMYHYETQPLPNPLSWYLHKLPPLVHKAGVLFTYFVELIVPWGYFAPPPFCSIAGAFTILLQLTLILSGNLSWLNYITIVLCISCFDDALLSRFISMAQPATAQASGIHQAVPIAVTVLILLLSIRPALNLISRRQRMNAGFDPLRLVNTYGAFGSVTRKRIEVVIQGASEAILTDSTQWREYEFKGKPGDVRRRPRIVSPYHYRLDWLMWFVALSPDRHLPWVLHLVAKLLSGDPALLGLLAHNPFPGAPPIFIRAELYYYRFTDSRDPSGDWWIRTRVGEYLPPLSLDDPAFRKVLKRI